MQRNCSGGEQERCFGNRLTLFRVLFVVSWFATVTSFTMMRQANLLSKRFSQGNDDTENAAADPGATMSAKPATSQRLDCRSDSKKDAEAYNLCASADVALSDAFVFNGIFSGKSVDGCLTIIVIHRVSTHVFIFANR